MEHNENLGYNENLEHNEILGYNENLENNENLMIMGCVYASPELMQENENDLTYPFNYAEMNYKEKYCMHCGQSLSDYDKACPKCGKNISTKMDLECTGMTCQNCGGFVPTISKYCPYCGNQWRELNALKKPAKEMEHNENLEHNEILGYNENLDNNENFMRMGCVYASPELMQKNANDLTYPFNYAEMNYKEKYCMHCGQSLSDYDKVCPKCGKNISTKMDLECTGITCQNCGEFIPTISKYCPYCGNQWRK